MLIGFKCPDGDCIEFEKCFKIRKKTCNNCFPKTLLAAIYASIEERTSYLSVTSLLYCLRKAALAIKENYFESPANLYYMFRGSMIHYVLEHVGKIVGPENFIEKSLFKKIPGTNITLKGTIDYFDVNELTLVDYKSMADKGAHILAKTGIKKEHTWQTNIYKWMIEDSLDENGKPFQYPVRDIQIVYMMMKTAFVTGHTYTIEEFGTRPKKIVLDNVAMFPSEKIEDFLVTRTKVLNESLPPASNDPDHKWMCKSCPFNEQCFKIEEPSSVNTITDSLF